jgi:hypothetical protein
MSCGPRWYPQRNGRNAGGLSRVQNARHRGFPDVRYSPTPVHLRTRSHWPFNIKCDLSEQGKSNKLGSDARHLTPFVIVPLSSRLPVGVRAIVHGFIRIVWTAIDDQRSHSFEQCGNRRSPFWGVVKGSNRRHFFRYSGVTMKLSSPVSATKTRRLSKRSGWQVSRRAWQTRDNAS